MQTVTTTQPPPLRGAERRDTSRWRPSKSTRVHLNWAVVLAIAAIVGLDWITPPGIAIGVLLCIPVFLTALADDPREIILTTGVAVLGFAASTVWGHAPVSPALIWVPNLVLVFLALPASCAVALYLHAIRRDVEAAHDQAVSSSELNQLLMSLLAHDLRSPLTLASQAFDYVGTSVDEGNPIDRELIADTRARLQRSLRAIEIVLAVARSEVASSTEGEREPRMVTGVKREIEQEVGSFAEEAISRGKKLETDFRRLHASHRWVDGLVLRQVLSILIDNALRYAVPGPVKVAAASHAELLEVRIADSGPGISAHRRGNGVGGSGLGLQLSRALAARAGGSLKIERDGGDGTTFLLCLPLERRPASR
ncbi:hypothetical protein BH20GEM2_BH20GEM2_09760 [soil metagenome]